MNLINIAKRTITAGNIFIVSGLLVIFFIALRPPTDPDLGWHLEDGAYLTDHNFQVARSDIFSHTMPDFPLVMHEWVTDILMHAAYQKFGFLALSAVFALIALMAFLTAALAVKAKAEYKIVAALLGVIASVPILGVRPQMLSLLGLSLVILIINKFRSDPTTKSIFWLPVLFVIWANMHGGFPVGLFFIGTYLGLELGKRGLLFIVVKYEKITMLRQWLEGEILKKKQLLKLAAFFSLSLLATLVNPYGWRIYVEVVTTIFDEYVRQNIGEWLPVDAANPMSYQFLIYLALLLILLIFNRRNNDYTFLAVASVFLFLSFRSWRHMPIFIIVSIPLWVSIVEFLVGAELQKIIRKKVFLVFAIVGAVVIAHAQITTNLPFLKSIEKVAEAGNYPLGAVKYLKENPIEGSMFNEYNWGGFLIWQYGEKKVFIDGRMPSWKMSGQKVFKEFNRAMKYETGWSDVLDKYDISFALVYDNQLNEANFLSIGWEKIYGDRLSAIFVRK